MTAKAKTVYLDHAATTPVSPEVAKAMDPYFKGVFGNASSVHQFGQAAARAVDRARGVVAEFLNCRPGEITFNSGATEGNNTVLKGVAVANKFKGHIITSAIEHHCVLETAEFLEKQGVAVSFIPVNRQGLIDPDQVAKAIRPETKLISVMLANNETGAIEPVGEIAAIARAKKILMHTDAVQAATYLDLDVKKLGVDFLTISAHKFYGPKGIGVLYQKEGTSLPPLLHGGAQENGRRAGTLNVPGIVGLGQAITLIKKNRTAATNKLKKLQRKLIKGIFDRIPEVKLNGPPPGPKRLPNNVNINFAKVEGESILLSLDMAGVAVSTGSACSSGSLEPSHVLLAMGVPKETVHGSIRFTLGRDTTTTEIDYVLRVLPPIIAKLRKISPLK